jgi:hypothetical protein
MRLKCQADRRITTVIPTALPIWLSTSSRTVGIFKVQSDTFAVMLIDLVTGRA